MSTPQPPPLVVDRMTVHEWNALARLLGALYSVSYDPVHERASFVHYDPMTGASRRLEID